MKTITSILLLLAGALSAQQWEAYPTYGEWVLSPDGNSASRPFYWAPPDLPCGPVTLTVTVALPAHRQADYSMVLTEYPTRWETDTPGFRRVAIVNDSGSFPRSMNVPSGNPLGKTASLDEFDVEISFDHLEGPCPGIQWLDGGQWMLPGQSGANDYRTIWDYELDGIPAGIVSGAYTYLGFGSPYPVLGTLANHSISCLLTQWATDATPETIDLIPVFDLTYDSQRAEVWRAHLAGGDDSIAYWPTFGRAQVFGDTHVAPQDDTPPAGPYYPWPEWSMPTDNPWWQSEKWGWIIPAWRHHMEEETIYAGRSPGRDWVYSPKLGWLWGGGSSFAWSATREEWVYAAADGSGWFFFTGVGQWEYLP